MSAGIPAKHSPARFSTYFAAHENHLAQLCQAGFVDSDTLVVEAYATLPTVWSIIGEISCRGEIILSVNKLLECVSDDPDPLIQTVRYSYHASVRGGGNILRYDNHHSRPEHLDDHHKHVFDVTTGAETIEWIGADRWPTLGEVLRELFAWHSDNYESLANPEAFATPENISDRLNSGLLP